MSVLLETTLGDLVVDLYTEARPRCCVNFLKLCKSKYYNYSTVFNVQRDFAVQCGDPEDSGDPKNGGSVFQKIHGDGARYFEANKLPLIKHDRPGLLSMINNGNDKFGSQVRKSFFFDGKIIFFKNSWKSAKILKFTRKIRQKSKNSPEIVKMQKPFFLHFLRIFVEFFLMKFSI